LPVDIAFLDVYARESWESVLHFLVGTASSEMQKPTSSVIVLLENSGLMGKQEGDLKSELVITQKGFQFLLQDVRLQVF
jgi:transcription initiation factor TFIIH subunit 4